MQPSNLAQKRKKGEKNTQLSTMSVQFASAEAIPKIGKRACEFIQIMQLHHFDFMSLLSPFLP